MKPNLVLLVLLCSLPYWSHSQIVRQETDKKDKNKTIVYKVEGSSDLDILNQIDADVEIGQEIQIAWEKPKQKTVNPPTIQQEKKQSLPKPIDRPQEKVIKRPSPPSVQPSSSVTKSPKVVAMSSKKRRKKKAFKAFTKKTKKQRRKKQNRKKCYTF